MAPRIDWNAPYGTIHPPMNGGMYEQNHNVFDGKGMFLFRHDGAPPEPRGASAGLLSQVAGMSAEEKAELAAALGLAPAPAPSRRRGKVAETTQQPNPPPQGPTDPDDEPRRQQAHPLENQHGGPQQPANPGENAEAGGAPKQDFGPTSVDLKAWLQGETFPWFAVRAALKAQFPSVDSSSQKTAVAGLKELNVLPADQIKRA